MVIVVCLRHTAARPRRVPHTALTPFVSCGVTKMACILHAANGIGTYYLYFTKSPSAYGIPISRAGMYENRTFTMASACCFCACFCRA